MWWVKSRRAAGMSWKRLTGSMTWRYSYLVVSRRAIPRCHPSTRASENVHAMAVPQAVHSSARQGSRAARSGPYATTATATHERGGGAGADVRLPVAVQRAAS